MELSVTHMFIANNQFIGVMKSSIVRDFHDIKLRLDFYRILTSDRQLMELIKTNCEKDHANVDTLKLVSTDTIYSKMHIYKASTQRISGRIIMNSIRRQIQKI